jgi:hypothetical protein
VAVVAMFGLVGQMCFSSAVGMRSASSFMSWPASRPRRESMRLGLDLGQQLIDQFDQNEIDAFCCRGFSVIMVSVTEFPFRYYFMTPATQKSGTPRFWLKLFNELNNRGRHGIPVIVVDGLRGFPVAIVAVYRQTQIQT